uniref:Uncharacterized protein n=1 Tax=viral metagenome TaxID=1070528 RepID=A0A6M3K9Q3_9ZZZZ
MTTLQLVNDTVDIGGTGQEPVTVFNRWGGERSVLFALDTTEKATISFDSLTRKYLWNGKDVKLLWYSKGIDEFAFDIVLTSKTAGNVIDMKMETSGLLFWPQHALTPEEIAQGIMQAEDVTDSIDIYHDSITPLHFSKEKAEKYKVGKLGQIKRILATDNTGKKTWCTQLKKNDRYQITIPFNWWLLAQPPITIDPDFGYKTAGNKYFQARDMIIGGSELNDQGTGTADSITAYVNSSVSSRKWKAAIYDTSGNLITNGDTPETTAGSTGDAWRTATYSVKPTVTNSVTYVLVHWGDAAPSGNWYVFYSEVAGTQYSQTLDYSAVSGVFPNPATFGTTGSRRTSIYCTFTLAAAGGNPWWYYNLRGN